MKGKLKKLMVLAVLLVVSLATGAANANLVAHWKLDETSGSTADDSSGNAHTGTLQGEPIWTRGKVDGALQLDGIDDYIDCGNYASLNITDEVTVTAWVKTDDSGNGEDNPYVVNGTHGIGLRQHESNNLEFLVHVNGVDKGWHTVRFPVDNSFNSFWHHLAGTYDGKELRIYVDGELRAASVCAGSVTSSNTSLNIGRNPRKTDRFFKGAIDDVRIYNHTLSGDDVAKLYYQDVFSSSQMLHQTVQDAEVILKEHNPKRALALIEKNIADYEQQTKIDSGGLAQKVLSSELYFQLARAKEAVGVPKEDVASAYKRAVKSGALFPPRLGSALPWLYENVSAEDYEDIVQSLIESNINYLKEIATKAEVMVREQKSKAAVRFLEANLTPYVRWQEKHPYGDMAAEHALPGIYFQLAKAKEAVGAPKKEIADTYSKTFNPSRFNYVPEQTTVLIWLLENECTNEYAAVIKSFTERRDIKPPSRDVVNNVCKYFESEKKWAIFERFLDTLFTEAKYPCDWAVFVESCLGDKTNRWAKAYFNYLYSRPRLKFSRDCLVAERYAAEEKFKEAADLYRDIVNRCGPEDDKVAFEFRLCKCMLDGGQYREAVPKLESFISNNKATHGTQVKEAMLMKGRSHVQLGELDKAIDSFFTMMVEYPETKEAPETHFFVGYCYMLQRKFDLATEAFDCVIKGYPQSAYASKAQLCMTRIKSMAQ